MTNSHAELPIRAIIEARATEFRAGGVDGMIADFADDIVTFDVVSPLRRDGILDTDHL
jgi:ketosteroid isomerase-like protein